MSLFFHTISELKPEDHICFFYRSEEEHRDVLSIYLREGLERNEKIVYILDYHDPDTICRYLSESGLQVEHYMDNGQLLFLFADEYYLRPGYFNPASTISLIRAEGQRAAQQGFPGVRIASEMTWVLTGRTGSERLVEYESKLNGYLPGSRVQLLCQYDVRRFEMLQLQEILSTHPYSIVGGRLMDNLYYRPKIEKQMPLNLAAEVEKFLPVMLDSDRRRAVMIQLEVEQKYHNLLKQIKAVPYTCEANNFGEFVYISPLAETILGYHPLEWISDPSFWLRHIHNKDRSKIVQKFFESRSGKEGFQAKYRFLDDQGRDRWVRDESVWELDSTGTPLFRQGVFMLMNEV